MGGNDHTLLGTAGQGEDAAKKAYEEVLKMNDVPAPLQSILRRKQTHILQSHDKLKAMRDATAAQLVLNQVRVRPGDERRALYLFWGAVSACLS